MRMPVQELEIPIFAVDELSPAHAAKSRTIQLSSQDHPHRIRLSIKAHAHWLQAPALQTIIELHQRQAQRQN